MIQQKTAEMLLGLDCSKRTLVELRSAMAGAQQAAKYVFSSSLPSFLLSLHFFLDDLRPKLTWTVLSDP